MANPLVLTITQGAEYQGLTFLVPGDWTAQIPKGQIRPEYDDNSEWVIDWDFLPLTYDPIENKTIVRPILGATKTSQIPVPPSQDKPGYKVGVNAWVTDFELHTPGNPDGTVKPLKKVLVKVDPEVTFSEAG